MHLIILIIIWRLVLFTVALITADNFSFTPRFPYADVYLIPSGLPQWAWAWANFDGVHYLTIARHGYSFAQFTQVFFPVYPLLLKVFGFITGDEYLILIGLILAFITFAFGVIVFKHLLELDYKKNKTDDTDVVKNAVWFLLLFPTSFYFGALYTEALFFLLVMGAFLLARKGKWWLSGIVAGIASATRITGIFLLPALLWEWHTQFKVQSSKFKVLKNQSRSNSFLLIVYHLLFITIRSPLLYLVPIGLISYMVYLQLQFGDWLYFWHVQPVFGAARSGGSLVFPLQTVWRYLKIMLTVSIYTNAFWIAILELSSFFATFFILILAHFKKIRFCYLLFSWLAFLTPVLTGTFSSLPRYILIIFPMFIILGSIKNRIVIWILRLLSAVLLFLLTSMFIRGLWVA